MLLEGCLLMRLEGCLLMLLEGWSLDHMQHPISGITMHVPDIT